eukprot:m51a1_g9654 hypothetical protein (206) ;mRNA; f:1192652-1193515
MPSVSSVKPVDKEGWCTKQGGSVKTWKKRWFVLSGNRLYYFKSKTDAEERGYIELAGTSRVKDVSGSVKNHSWLFSIEALSKKGARTFLVSPGSLQEVSDWVDAVQRNISAVASASSGGSVQAPVLERCGLPEDCGCGTGTVPDLAALRGCIAEISGLPTVTRNPLEGLPLEPPSAASRTSLSATRAVFNESAVPQLPPGVVLEQ